MNENKRKESFFELVGGKTNAIAMAIFAVIFIGGGILLMDYLDVKERESHYLATWPITINQHVQLTYAKPVGGGGR